eukprot:Phypoly_transcript_13222.p1 GENE.Phypoly_transcript_13222~~Phypoly_transcript_13222.p1  ORF type:complete len:251 (+),score=49.99 Phypoly_transcript_13222:304-1056(+)
MASDPHECCKKGTPHSGSSTGSETKIEGLDVYVSEPPTPTDKAVLLISDAFGWKLPNSRLLADYYAKEANVKVFLPDFFEGKPAPAEILTNAEFRAKYDFTEFINANSREKKWPTIQNFAKALKEKHSVSKLGAIGFCWGAMGTILLTGTDLVDGGAVAHPSLLSVPTDIENISKPVLFLCAEKDFTFSDDQRKQTEEILEKKKPLYSKVKVYPGTQHGFAVRGNPEYLPEAQAAQDAKQEAAAFFKTIL